MSINLPSAEDLAKLSDEELHALRFDHMTALHRRIDDEAAARCRRSLRDAGELDTGDGRKSVGAMRPVERVEDVDDGA